MTTQEEKAEKYAEGYRCPATNENEYCRHDIISAYNNGYTQCQEDMVELLRTELTRAFVHGQGNAQMMEAGLERDEVEEYVNWRMLSINKTKELN
jgi:hypothetical protein